MQSRARDDDARVQKPSVLLKLAPKIKTVKIAAISQVMTVRSRWRRSPQHCMKKQERSRASFFNSQTFVMEGKMGNSCAKSRAKKERKTVRSSCGVWFFFYLLLLRVWKHPHTSVSPSVLWAAASSPFPPLLLHLRTVWKLRMNHRGALLCALRPCESLSQPLWSSAPGRVG